MSKVYVIGSCEWLEQHKNDPGVAATYAKEIAACKQRKEEQEARRASKRAEKQREQLGRVAKGARQGAGQGSIARPKRIM